MRIACIPVHSLFDSPLTIRISGANAHQKLTVCCTVQHATGDYISFAHYVTNEHGDVDLRTMPSVGGMYVGNNILILSLLLLLMIYFQALNLWDFYGRSGAFQAVAREYVCYLEMSQNRSNIHLPFMMALLLKVI